MPGGDKVAMSESNLKSFAEELASHLPAVLEALSDPEARILRPVGAPASDLAGGGETRYEIFHDVLAPAVLDWRGRYVQDQQRAEAEQQLAQERRRAIRWRLGAIGLASVLFLVVALAVFAVRQSREATRQSRISLAQSLADM